MVAVARRPEVPAEQTDGHPSPFVIGLHVRPYNWRLRRARQAKGLTQAQLAELADTNVGTIQHLELLHKRPRIDWTVVDRVAAVLEVPADELFPRWLCTHNVRELLEGDIAIGVPEEVGGDPEGIALQDVVRGEMCVALDRALKRLPARHRDLLELRFGLQDGHYRTLEAVGLELGVTRERVREMEQWALTRLRNPKVMGSLRPYLEA